MRTDLRIANTVLATTTRVQLPAYSVDLWRPHRYKILWGGRGGARSWTVARTLLLKAAQQKLRVLCAREMQSSIKDSVHQLLRDQIELMGLTGYIVTDREIRHINGSFFIFAGLRHNTSKIKSLEGIDVCWVEEAERITKESWAILIPTIRKTGSEIWVTFNPDQATDATYARFITHAPTDCWAKKVGWEDNPWLTPELRAEKDYMYATDPDAADHVWGGNIRKNSAAQILKDKWVVENFIVPIDQHGDVIGDEWSGPYYGMDFGFGADPVAGVRCWIKRLDGRARELYIDYEAYGHGVDIDQTPDLLVESLPRIAAHTVRADSARPDSISYLARHGIARCVGAKKGPGSIEDGITHLRSYTRIVVHSRCKHTIDECKLWSYKVDLRSGDILPIVVDKHNHIMDSLRYALEPMIKPRIRAGFIFLGADRVRACPVCESYLPDDGECPHCGAHTDMETGELIDATEPSAAALVAHAIMAEPVHTNGNGNGNGHHANGNGNGNGNGHGKLRMRDLNR
jgi:phage terminase, large subunit, PBSX family